MGIQQRSRLDSMNIWMAASDGDIGLVEELLTSGRNNGQPLDVNIKDEYGYTPLHAAVSYNHVELAKLLLLKYKANVNIQDEEGDSPLHLTETEEIARILVENGADPNLKNDDGFIPIQICHRERNNQVVEYLTQFTPNVSLPEQEDSDVDYAYIAEHILPQLYGQSDQEKNEEESELEE